jgi:hypothetical protein
MDMKNYTRVHYDSILGRIYDDLSKTALFVFVQKTKKPLSNNIDVVSTSELFANTCRSVSKRSIWFFILRPKSKRIAAEYEYFGTTDRSRFGTWMELLLVWQWQMIIHLVWTCDERSPCTSARRWWCAGEYRNIDRIGQTTELAKSYLCKETPFNSDYR